jgi:hypothetical protein
MLVRAARQSLRLRLGKGNAPGRMKPKRARAPHVEKSGDGCPNRQRDETPEAKPLRQQCLCAESAKHHRSKEGLVLTGQFEEPSPCDSQSLGRCEEKAGLVSAQLRSVR